MRFVFSGVFLCWAATALAQDVVIIGEIHDNPAHHLRQAEIIAKTRPAAVVFEMITAEQAAKITHDMRDDPDRIADALDWAQSGWPDFSLYAPVWAAASEAAIHGALVPGPGNALMTPELSGWLDGLKASYGLDDPLPAGLQNEREAHQAQAHCGALPADVLPAMVRFQRLRDAALADATLTAIRKTGGPVVVITGNGHARRDWGVPAYLAEKAPDLDMQVIGQGEDGAPPPGDFDMIIDAPGIARPDPCLAFQ